MVETCATFPIRVQASVQAAQNATQPTRAKVKLSISELCARYLFLEALENVVN